MSASYAPKNMPPPEPQKYTRGQTELPEPSREALPDPKPRLPSP